MGVLGKVEHSAAHYLVENKISWHPTHILSSVNTLMTLVILLPTSKNKNLTLVSFSSLNYKNA
jgi:hypothetical protein